METDVYFQIIPFLYIEITRKGTRSLAAIVFTLVAHTIAALVIEGSDAMFLYLLVFICQFIEIEWRIGQ